MPARKTVDDELAALNDLPAERGARSERLAAALVHRHCRVVAKAARLCAEALLYELAPALIAAYARFLDKPAKTDPGCLAKKAITRALGMLECNDVDFLLAGLRYRQPEPVWGGTADTAVDVRCQCAMTLVASGYSRALASLTELLHDAEPGARVGAVRAIACGNPREAELLLRSKVLAGDEDAAVIGECFTALLAVEPEESVAFVARYLAEGDDSSKELAALALGESRLDAALAPLRAAWDDALVADGVRRALLRAAAAHKSEAALDWVLSVVADARTKAATEILESLAIFRHDKRLAERLGALVRERAEPELQERFAVLWQRSA
jgi:HEAT repeat protein